MQNEKLNNLVLCSDLNELTELELFLFTFFSENKISMIFFRKIYLCISEAVMNSIIHGNKFDENKKILICLCLENKIIKAKIADQGEGFNILDVKDPTKNEYIKNESGRGIHIIRSYSDEICFNSTGNEIQIKFSIHE